MNEQAKVVFFGSRSADLFTLEIEHSFAAVLEKDFFRSAHGGLPEGYVQASPTGQFWSNTMWTRDGGTFMRELVQWGYLKEACQLANCLMDLVTPNEEGYISFPEYFDGAKPGSGMELDGTASIVIGMVALHRRLPQNDSTRTRIESFLLGSRSPVAFLCHRLAKSPLVAGSGEFGPGCGLPGTAVNVVQNGLIIDALAASAGIADLTSAKDSSKRFRQLASKIAKAMKKHLIDADGKWIWCVDPNTMQPDPEVINYDINKGFGGLNGVASMRADVFGFEPISAKDPFIEPSTRTLEGLYSFPLRKQQYDKYGIWTQFDTFRAGLSTSPSYGQCYALQTMLLYDRLDMADRGLKWFAEATYDLVPGYDLPRESPYYIHERMYSPDATGKTPLEAGCGALNLVNVTEAMKVARLVLGVDDTSAKEIRILPRIIPSWKGVSAENWPICTSKGVVHADIRIEKQGRGCMLKMTVRDGAIPNLSIRLPSSKGFLRLKRRNVRYLQVASE